MDRKVFKQRMQELKSYREQNPGKGYLDWKASKYAEGGEIPPERMEYKGKLYTYENIDEYVNMTPPVRQSDPNTFASVRPRSGEKIYLSTDNIQKPSDMADGLIRHEVGHPKKYESFDRSKYMLNKNTEEEAKRYYDYLREPTEKKSIMNQFEEYLKNHYTPLTYPTTVKEFQDAIMNAPDSQKHMKDLLKLHVKPSILFRDFKNVPLVDNAKRNNNLV